MPVLREIARCPPACDVAGNFRLWLETISKTASSELILHPEDARASVMQQ
jgi:predicted amidohydrolase